MEKLKAFFARVKAWFVGAKIKVKVEYAEAKQHLDEAKDKLEHEFETKAAEKLAATKVIAVKPTNVEVPPHLDVATTTVQPAVVEVVEVKTKPSSTPKAAAKTVPKAAAKSTPKAAAAVKPAPKAVLVKVGTVKPAPKVAKPVPKKVKKAL